jgi:hypothetical protein
VGTTSSGRIIILIVATTIRAIGLERSCAWRVWLLLVVLSAIVVGVASTSALVGITTSMVWASVAHVAVNGLSGAPAYVVHLRDRSHLITDRDQCLFQSG